MTQHIKGAREVAARLAGFSEKLREAAGRRAARRAMGVVRADARKRLQAIDDPGTPTDIAKNVYIQQSRSQSRAIGGVAMRVGILGGARPDRSMNENRKTGQSKDGNPGGDTRYWRFVELGTEKVAPRPFLRPALEQNAGQVLEVLIDALAKEVNRIAAEGK